LKSHEYASRIAATPQTVPGREGLIS
jgi:hypothetical protein